MKSQTTEQAKGGQSTAKRKVPGENIVRVRGFYRMSQKVLAGLAGVSPDTLREWEKMNDVPEEIIKRLAKAMDVDEDKLSDPDLENFFSPFQVGNLTGNNVVVANSKEISYSVTNPEHKEARQEFAEMLKTSQKEKDTLVKAIEALTNLCDKQATILNTLYPQPSTPPEQ